MSQIRVQIPGPGHSPRSRTATRDRDTDPRTRLNRAPARPGTSTGPDHTPGGLGRLSKVIEVTYAPLALTIPLAAALLLLAVPAYLTGYWGRGARLQRRGRLGLHTPAAQASDAAFALANRVAAPVLLGAAAVGGICAAVLLALPVGVAGAIIAGVLGLAGMFGLMAAGSNLGERAARTVPLPARTPAGCCGAGGCGCGGSSAGTTPGTSIPDLVPDAALH